MDLSKNFVVFLINSPNPFPVDFDDGWRWIGYTRKHDAKRKLQKNFNENVDFRVLRDLPQNSTQQEIEANSENLGGRPTEIIKLTVDCYKAFCMMAGTEKGRQVREYFLECEKIAKSAATQAACPDLVRLEKKMDTLAAQMRHLQTGAGKQKFWVRTRDEALLYYGEECVDAFKSDLGGYLIDLDLVRRQKEQPALPPPPPPPPPDPKYDFKSMDEMKAWAEKFYRDRGVTWN